MANNFYTHGNFPASNSKGASAGMRAELDAIMAAFDLMPNPAGPGLKGFTGGVWNNVNITNGNIDGTTVGATAPAAGKFSTLSASGLATFANGISMAGVMTAQPGSNLTGFTFLSGLINGTPIGTVTPSSGSFTNLTATGTINLPGLSSSGGGSSFGSGSIELGTPASTTQAFIDFHSSTVAANDYDARITATGGTGQAGNGHANLYYFAANHAFDHRPSFAGYAPWDALNLPNPFTTSGGTINGQTDHNAALRMLQASAINFYSQGNTYAAYMRADSAGFVGILNGAQSAWNLLVYDSGAVTLRIRPTWGGLVPYDNGNLTALSQLANNVGYITAGATVANANLIRGNNFTFTGNGGQPVWLWGNNGDANTMLWNPANFSVNYANSAGSAGSAGSVGGVTDPASRSYTGSSVGAQVEIGPLSAPGTGALDAGAPYVMVGIRCGAWRGPSADCIGVLYSRLTQVQQR